MRMPRPSKSKVLLVALSIAIIPAGILALLLAPLVIAFGSTRYGWRVLRSFDRFVNATMGGHELQTVSGRAYNDRHTFLGWALDRLLNLVEKDHCERSAEGDNRLVHYARTNIRMKGEI